MNVRRTRSLPAPATLTASPHGVRYSSVRYGAKRLCVLPDGPKWL